MINEKSKPTSDRKLIDLCLRGDLRAQRELYEKFSARMYPVCFRYVSNREVAKDVLHDGFILVFSKLNTFSGDGSFEGWIRRIFVNCALMHLRKNDALKFSEEIDSSTINIQLDSGPLENLNAKEIMEIVATMPTGFRTVFNLYVVEGYSHQEIAEKLNISEGSSRSQLNRAKGWLKKRIKDRW